MIHTTHSVAPVHREYWRMDDEVMRRRGGRRPEGELVLAGWDCGSPLYDSFELASLYHVLESHLMMLPFPAGLDHRRAAAVVDVDEHGATATTRRRRTTGRMAVAAAAAATAAILRSAACWRTM
ncbi:hypothetical protein GUJ93_ZPchr0007g5319 [Zizania palustris]|uniref:Uncharacterized protein n=1 Tax=Zizania palustris TaxID=103762 RepID=A0A8J5T2I2_ZIZPA|nr:hypothetical protein GUJ93_ZPchr0007g5319 [Zizania palustris]